LEKLIDRPQYYKYISSPKINIKKLENCDVQNIDNQVNAVVGAHMKNYRKKWQTTAGKSQLG
jgi:hypothetical protein